MVKETNSVMSEPTLEAAQYQNEAMMQIVSAILAINCGHPEALALIGKVLSTQHEAISKVLNRSQVNARETDKTLLSS